MNVQNNALSNLVFERLKYEIFQDNVSWNFVANTAYQEAQTADPIRDFSWELTTFKSGKAIHELFHITELAVRLALDNSNQTLSKIHRIRIGLITATNAPHVHGPHVDYQFPHTTGLIYLNDSDGDTIFYNEIYDPTCKLNSEKYYTDKLKSIVTVKETFTPKENTFVWFNGLQYHSSTSPITTQKRLVINFNYEN